MKELTNNLVMCSLPLVISIATSSKIYVCAEKKLCNVFSSLQYHDFKYGSVTEDIYTGCIPCKTTIFTELERGCAFTPVLQVNTKTDASATRPRFPTSFLLA